MLLNKRVAPRWHLHPTCSLGTGCNLAFLARYDHCSTPSVHQPKLDLALGVSQAPPPASKGSSNSLIVHGSTRHALRSTCAQARSCSRRVSVLTVICPCRAGRPQQAVPVTGPVPEALFQPLAVSLLVAGLALR